MQQPFITPGGYVQHGTDNGLFVEFSVEPYLNNRKSDEAGRPIHEDREFITIRIPGDTKTVVKRFVKTESDSSGPSDLERWPRQYEAFKKQISQEHCDGTALEEWPMVTRSEVLNLKAMNIHTVEALAELGENGMNWTGARLMRDKAKAYLENAKNGIGVSGLAKENEFLKGQIAYLTDRIAAIEAKNAENGQNIEDNEVSEPKKRGRKPKIQE